MHVGRRTGRRVLLALALVGAFATSACAAGQQAQTGDERPTLDGTEADVGNIALRGLVINTPPNGTSYAKGSDAAVTVVLSNSGEQSDRLTSISSPAFSSWAAFTDMTDANAVQDADAATGGTSSSAASSGATSTSLPSGTQSVTIGAGSRVGYGTPEATGALLIKGFTGKVYPGSTVSVTFTFADAGQVKVAVPIAITNSSYSSVVPGSSASDQDQNP